MKAEYPPKGPINVCCEGHRDGSSSHIFSPQTASLASGSQQFCLKLTLTKVGFNMQEVTKHNLKCQAGNLFCSDNTISWTIKYNLRAGQSHHSLCQLCSSARPTLQHARCRTAIPPKILMQWFWALTASYLCISIATAFTLLPVSLGTQLLTSNQISRKASLTPSPTGRHLCKNCNTDDKCLQHFHRVRERGVWKCLTTVKGKL